MRVPAVLRRWLLWLLVAIVPVHASALAAMAIPMTLPMASAEAAISRPAAAATVAEHATPMPCHDAVAPAAEAGDDTGPHGKAGCAACAACVALGAPPFVAGVTTVAVAEPVASAPPQPVAAFLTGGVLRPPRPIAR